ncbi:hypothetical protein AWC38_SpisGene10242 [Stylophora pistillata]|uniref:Uncharacterized protein n=2 Tax=Stylophora pistillata TaxID=50429 RepID=A0A2B4S5E1_STYPI|nr:hypothetical protein AWC38_SpisGene10242 [Stylophora pistillata]
MENQKNINQTNFIFSIEDHIYPLDKRIHILQISAKRSIFLQSSHANGSTISCTSASAGFDIGLPSGQVIKTRNINIAHLRFQNCGSHFAAVVLIWNSLNINFRNCTFARNKQSGINAFDSEVTVNGCLFLNNTSNRNSSSEVFKKGYTTLGGGAGFLFQASVSLSVVIKNSNFTLNSAVKIGSSAFVAPVSPIFSELGGGILVMFSGKTNHCSVEIQNTDFYNNSATFGGGCYLSTDSTTFNNSFFVSKSSFVGNRAMQAGGGLKFSHWHNSSRITSILKNCTVTENQARRGAGMEVHLKNFDEKPRNSVLRLVSVVFKNNQGNFSSALNLQTKLPHSKKINLIPEFINCTFEDHHITFFSGSNTFTSQRVDVRFKGKNIFRHNLGGSASNFQDCVVHIEGQLVFAYNVGVNGGALFMMSSQIILYPGSELMFLKNGATTLGGAICVFGALMNNIITSHNPDCFMTYSESHLPASQWKTNVSFIENFSFYKGAAIYISSLQRCQWSEEAPHTDPKKALRWSNNFVYRNNSLFPGGLRYLPGNNDISTETKSYHHSGAKSPIKLAPGQLYDLKLRGYDELGNNVPAWVFPLETDGLGLDTALRVWPNSPIYLLSPGNSSTTPFSYGISEALYREIQNSRSKPIRKVKFVDLSSSLNNKYVLEIELQKCPPGFDYDSTSRKCKCTENAVGIERCDGNSLSVFIKDGYWANVTEDGTLITYYCPYGYCQCVKGGDGKAGCLFDPLNSNAQCSKNREGWLCGKCSGNTSVGFREHDCHECSSSNWEILPMFIFIALFLCGLVIWLNPGISSEIRGPLFFFQILPYIYDPTLSKIPGFVKIVIIPLMQLFSFSFGTLLVYFLDPCIAPEIDNLYLTAFGYIFPSVAVFVFLLAYLLSVNYCLQFRFRGRSMLKAFWFLLVFVYCQLVETSVKILNCVKPVGSSKYLFFFDGTITCFEHHHLPFAIIAILALVIIVLPPPIIVFLLTKGCWRADPQYSSTVTSGLHPQRRWWWSVDLLRRALLILIYILVQDWQLRQVLMIFASIIILAVHSNCQPYLRTRVNFSESFYLLALCTIAVLCTLPIKKLVGSGTAEIVCEVLVSSLAFHTSVVFVLKAVGFFRQHFDCACVPFEEFARRSGYEKLGDTEFELSLDLETERRKNLFEPIFPN